MSRLALHLSRIIATLAVFALLLRRPRLGIPPQPRIALLLPLPEQAARERIREAEGDEKCDLLLLPMREPVHMARDLRRWIEKAQLGVHRAKVSAASGRVQALGGATSKSPRLAKQHP